MHSSEQNVLIVAGEASGDRHAARLVGELRRRRSGLRFWGIGGELLRQQGVETLYDAAETNVVGFVEVLKRYRFFKGIFRTIQSQARSRRPSLAILVDYPGFNIRLAESLHAAGIPVLYYIAPQVWAWKEGRVKKLRRYVSDLVVVFPFEIEFFAKHGMNPRFFGHPLIDQIEELRGAGIASHGDGSAGVARNDTRRTIAYLPGSRPEEIARHMPVLSRVIASLGPGYRHVIPLATTISRELLEQYRDGAPFEIVGSSHEALSGASAALVKSGTSTLDATLHGVPFAAMYKTSGMSYQIARRLIKVPYIAMTNVLAGRLIVREFIQDEMNPDALLAEVRRLLEDADYRKSIERGLAEVRDLFGSAGSAGRLADFILEHYLPLSGDEHPER